MATDTNTTNTDKTDFSVIIVDKTKYNNLSNDDKIIFELLRNSILEIFPLNDKNKYDELCLKFAENFAFINLNGLNKIIELKVQTAIQELRTEINNVKNSSNTSAV